MKESTIPLIDWRRLRWRNPLRLVFDAVVIFLLLIVGFVVLCGLRAYCVLWRGGHRWEHFPGNEFTPALDSECSCCGARKPHQGPRFRWDDEE